MKDQTILMAGLGALFLAIVVAVVSLAWGSVGRTGVARALATIDRVYAPGSASPQDESLRVRVVGPAGRAFAGVARSATPRGAAGLVQRWLDYAGNPAAWPPERIIAMQGLGLLVFTSGALLVNVPLFLLDVTSFGVLVLGTIAAGLFGLWLPVGILYDIGSRRQDEIRRQLPDSLDLLILTVEAGLGFDAALSQVASTMPGPLAREYARVLHEMQMGQRRADALRALGQRTRVTELRTMAISVVQASELGIPIADVLREQARQMRLRRRQHAEEQARKVPVKVVFPLVICLFPALFIVIIGPGIINIMRSF